MDNVNITKNIIEEWPKIRPLYEELGKLVEKRLKEEIYNVEIYPNVTFRTKDALSLIKKALRLKSKNAFEEITDKLGVRVVSHYKSDLKKIETLIQDLFVIKKKDLKAEELAFNQLGYTSDHYDVHLKENKFENCEHFKDMTFEIQVRTICQNTWADIAHGLTYKQENQDEQTKRRIFRLTSLFEIADDEFDGVNNYLIESPENAVYKLLSQIEGKFYKLAKLNFHREMSFENLATLLKIDQNNYLKEKGIEDFILQNEQKIEKIFLERLTEMTSNFFLSQPEIMVIWYLLEKDKYVLEEEWPKHFDKYYIEQIAIYWGTPLE